MNLNIKEYNQVSECCGTKMNLTVETDDNGKLFLDYSELCSCCLNTASFIPELQFCLQMSETNASDESLVDAVIEKIKDDIEYNDLTAIDELLHFLPKERLVGFLPEAPDDQVTNWDFDKNGDYDITPQNVYCDYGHAEGVKTYTETEALEVIKKLLSKDTELLNGRDIKQFSTLHLLNIGNQFYDIHLQHSESCNDKSLALHILSVEEELKKDTLLIAEFMGLYNVHENNGRHSCNNCGHEYSAMLGDDEVPMIHTDCDPDLIVLAKYHESWDALMPVIEKCYAKCTVELDGKEMHDVNQAQGECNLQGTYGAVIKFIKLLNNQK